MSRDLSRQIRNKALKSRGGDLSTQEGTLVSESMYKRDDGLLQNVRVTSIGDDHVYYNLNLYNPYGTGTNYTVQRASFLDQRTSAIIDNPSDWKMSIIRFSVPTSYIPLSDVSTPTYTVTLSYGGNDYSTNLVFNPPPLPFTSNVTAQYINSYHIFFLALNEAFLTSWLALLAAHPSVPAVQAPFVVYDPATSLISLIVDAGWNSDVAGNPQIWVSYDLYSRIGLTTSMNYFSSFSYPKQTQWLVYYKGNNYNTYSSNGYTGATGTFGPTGTNYFTMTEDAPSIGNLDDVKSIVFTSSGLPTRGEALGFNFTGTGSTSSQPTVKIISDYELVISGNEPSPRANVLYQYQPVTYRWIDLLSNTPISTVDIQTYWEDNNGNLVPLALFPGDSFTMKILFKKGLVTQ